MVCPKEGHSFVASIWDPHHGKPPLRDNKTASLFRLGLVLQAFWAALCALEKISTRAEIQEWRLPSLFFETTGKSHRLFSKTKNLPKQGSGLF